MKKVILFLLITIFVGGCYVNYTRNKEVKVEISKQDKDSIK